MAMSTVDTALADASVRSSAGIAARRHRWTRDEYHRIADLGVLGGRRVELIHGDIVEMSPPKEQHVIAVENVEAAVKRAFEANQWVRTQAPLSMPDDSEPMPDVAVVPGPRGRYSDHNHPPGALLVVEVSDSTLLIDRTEKAGLYASAGVEDYWILNLCQRQLEVYRKPIQDTTCAHGHRYGELKTLAVEESIAPLAAPERLIEVAELLL